MAAWGHHHGGAGAGLCRGGDHRLAFRIALTACTADEGDPSRDALADQRDQVEPLVEREMILFARQAWKDDAVDAAIDRPVGYRANPFLVHRTLIGEDCRQDRKRR